MKEKTLPKKLTVNGEGVTITLIKIQQMRNIKREVLTNTEVFKFSFGNWLRWRDTLLGYTFTQAEGRFQMYQDGRIHPVYAIISDIQTIEDFAELIKQKYSDEGDKVC